MNKATLSIVLLVLFSACSQSQNSEQTASKLVGGPCEGCESIFEFGSEKLNSVDTLPDFKDEGPQLKITGTIYQPDGKTPAKGVILYIYHTDQKGIYVTKGDETGWAKRHGYLRGWVKTNKSGRYAFYTLKPAPYPGRSNPAHIHPTILEPNGKYYWLHASHFSNDPMLTKKELSIESPRGGNSGLLLELKKESNLWVGNRDIILGKNIPNYDKE